MLDGATFGGWYQDSALTIPFFFTTDTITTNLTLYAGWNEPNHYIVRFNTNGGSAVAEQQVVLDGTATVPENPTLDGGVFVRWYTSNTFTTAFDFATPITTNTIIYAGWELTLRFDTNGGTPNIDAQTVLSVRKATQPDDPKKDGFTFGGWYKDEALTTAFNFNTAITKSTILYAGWNLTVTFNTNGGSAISAQTILIGSKAIEPENPTRDGATFVGWYKDVVLTIAFNFNTAITKDTTLYAGWDVTVTFNTNGGSAISAQTILIGSKAIEPENPTRDGATFVGWYKDVEFKLLFDFDTDTITTNTILYARWLNPNQRTVRFNLNGGSVIPEQIIALGKKATQPENPTKVGYTFGGWYTDVALTTAFNFNTAITKDITLYARWNAYDHYTITFKPNDGSFIPENRL